MKQYTVTGMSCAACSARVEKAVSKVDGVTSCSVSLLTNLRAAKGSAGCACRQGDTEACKQAYSIAHILSCSYVFFHGTYDVGLAVA